MGELYCKSCENMSELEDNSIDLIVTSPPYWNAIDYDQHTIDSSKWYRTRKGDEYDIYLDWLKSCFSECHKKLKPGRYCCVVIGTVLYNGKHYPLPYHFTKIMEEIGFIFHQDIIWYKVTGGVKRAGVTIQNPYPGYYCPNIMTEYILIFRKEGPKIFEKRDITEKEENKIPIDELFTKELANNIWHIAPVPPNQYDHPCPFPEEIPYRLILLYSYKGDKILDPFVGIGTTTKVAKRLGRDYFGYDIKEKYIKIANKRLNEPLYLRKQLICNFEKLQMENIKEEVPYQLTLFDIKRESKISNGKIGYLTDEGTLSSKINYSQIIERCKWLKEKNLNIIISPDLDGFLCMLFLKRFLGWNLVGFYNSETLWLDKKLKLPKDYDKIVFIDVDINRKEVKSIGHHILSWSSKYTSEEHNLKYGTRINPNLERDITKEEFKKKYLFGTIHFLIALYNTVISNLTLSKSKLFIPLLLFVDSTLKNSIKYLDNALDWIDSMGGSESNSPLYPICKIFATTFFKRVYFEMEQLYNILENINFKRDTQCVINDPLNEEEWNKMNDLLTTLIEITEWDVIISDIRKELICIKGERKRVDITKQNFEKVIEGINPFSYAIISQAYKGGLNYTILPNL